MAEHCPTPTRDCPVTTDFLLDYGKMQREVTEIHTIVANGNGLVTRVQTLETEKHERDGALKSLKLLVIVVGSVPVVLKILSMIQVIP